MVELYEKGLLMSTYRFIDLGRYIFGESIVRLIEDLKRKIGIRAAGPAPPGELLKLSFISLGFYVLEILEIFREANG